MHLRIALVEDNPTYRQRLLQRFQYFEDIELVLTASSGDAFLHQLDTLLPEARPHAVLMDIEMPGLSGIETTARLKARYPDINVIMLTVFEDEDRIFDAIQAGAAGYLLKDATTDKILGALFELADGGAPMAPAVARTMMTFVRRHRQAEVESAQKAAAFDLSVREMEVLALLVKDEQEVDIARRLFISPHTVRTHVKNIYRKLNVRTRASAVRVAMRYNLLSRTN